eukprot:11501175-Alexandrium_andersonii.AAC.1
MAGCVAARTLRVAFVVVLEDARLRSAARCVLALRACGRPRWLRTCCILGAPALIPHSRAKARVRAW